MSALTLSSNTIHELSCLQDKTEASIVALGKLAQSLRQSHREMPRTLAFISAKAALTVAKEEAGHLSESLSNLLLEIEAIGERVTEITDSFEEVTE